MDRPAADITRKVLGCAFDVHSRLGPGLLESAYQACLHHRMVRAGLKVESEVPIAINFDGVSIPTAYRADIVVENRVLIELKAVERLLPVHLSQTLTYLKHSDLEVALLLNFNVQRFRQGIRRFDRLSRLSIPPPPPYSPASPSPL